jgi:excisionase family DNA binding protein
VNSIAAHLSAALAGHIRALRRDGLPIPPEIAALQQAFSVSSAQQCPPFDPGEQDSEHDRMPLAVTYGEAGDLLRVSESTIRRAVDSGELTAVAIGGAVRIRAADIARFVEELPPKKERL